MEDNFPSACQRSRRPVSARILDIGQAVPRASASEQVIAVGDGANDLPMLRLAGLGIAFRATPLVRQSARQSMSTMGLNGILYLLGVRDREALV